MYLCLNIYTDDAENNNILFLWRLHTRVHEEWFESKDGKLSLLEHFFASEMFVELLTIFLKFHFWPPKSFKSTFCAARDSQLAPISKSDSWWLLVVLNCRYDDVLRNIYF